MSARFIWIAIFVSVAIALLIVGAAGLLVFGIFKVMDSTEAHRCGLALVQKDPQAIEMLGEPIQQKWFTGGNANVSNGKTTQDITFTVYGPKGEATVEADGVKSNLDSHLTVRFGRDQQSHTIYDGPFDCQALHQGSN